MIFFHLFYMKEKTNEDIFHPISWERLFLLFDKLFRDLCPIKRITRMVVKQTLSPRDSIETKRWIWMFGLSPTEHLVVTLMKFYFCKTWKILLYSFIFSLTSWLSISSRILIRLFLKGSFCLLSQVQLSSLNW